MVGKRDLKGKAPMKSVSIADGEYEYSPRSQPASPGPSNPGHSASRRGSGGGGGSPVSSHVSAASQSRSQPKPEDSHQPTTSAPAFPTTTATSGPQVTASRYTALPTPFAQQQYAANWRPYVGYAQGGLGAPFAPVASPFAPMGNLFGMAIQQQDPPAPVNPPDELGPPPPPLPPPAIPPVLNPFGVHFQPQVPGTEMGPMTHRYVPRHDHVGAPGMLFPGQQMQMPGMQMPGMQMQMPGFMANGTTMPMMSMAQLPVGVAPVTAPMNPIVVQQPGGQPMVIQQPGGQPMMMIQNPAMPGGPSYMLPGTAQAMQMQGNHPFIAGLPAQPPVHVEPAMGVGLTPNETIAQNMRIAQDNKAYEPQDFKPADPDPYRMYWFRELNHHWAVFPRRQIDRLHARWYRTDDGVFYAIRLSDLSD